MRTIPCGLVLLALLLSGCSPASTPTPELPPSPTQTSQPVESATPELTIPVGTTTPTHLPNAIPTDQLDKSVFRFYEGNPILQRSNNPDWDNQFIDPGAMVYHEGKFYMFFNGINGFPALVGVGYATSEDGLSWTRQVSEPVLSATEMGGTNLLGDNFFVTSALVEPDGTWILYFYTLGSGGFMGPGGIGRATAPGPTGPWTVDPEPLLSPGPDGAWDSVQVSGPSVLKTEDGYLMYYDGLGNGSTSLIGLATSPDGVQWTKYNDPATEDSAFAESDPVLKTSDSGWDARRVIDPNVIETADGFEMIYLATTGSGKFAAGDFAFGAATSLDGIEWTRSNLNPVLSTRDHPKWSQAFLANLLQVDETYFLYFDVVASGTGGTNVYVATYDGSLK